MTVVTGLHLTRLVTARLAAASLLVSTVAPSWAVLGGDAATIQADQMRLRAQRQAIALVQGGTVQELRMADGSSIRQFVNAQGKVYAVAWSTRLKPDFAQMLGRHAAEFDAGVASTARQPGLQRRALVDRGDLVVDSAGRPGAFVGRAWLKSMVPTGTTVDAIR
jgi:Protein of unknown function (DUF2844)